MIIHIYKKRTFLWRPVKIPNRVAEWGVAIACSMPKP